MPHQGQAAEPNARPVRVILRGRDAPPRRARRCRCCRRAPRHFVCGSAHFSTVTACPAGGAGAGACDPRARRARWWFAGGGADPTSVVRGRGSNITFFLHLFALGPGLADSYTYVVMCCNDRPGPDRGGSKVVDFTRSVSSRASSFARTQKSACTPARASFPRKWAEFASKLLRRRSQPRGTASPRPGPSRSSSKVQRIIAQTRCAAESPTRTRHTAMIFSL